MRRVCLVGAGYIADTHAEVLAGLPNLQIAAVVDPSERARERLARRWKIARAFANSDAAIASGEVDCAHVLTPPDLHVVAAKPWIEAGLPVLIEKPIAATLGQAEELASAASRSGSVVGVNQNFVHHPAYLALRHAIEAHRLGPARALHCSFNVPLRQLASGQLGHWMFDRPLNLLLEQAVHPLSQILDLAGEVTGVSARPGPRRMLSRGAPFYDSVTVLLDTPRIKVTFQFRVGASFPRYALTAICDDGVAHADILGNRFYMEQRGPELEFLDAYRANRRTARALLSEGRRNALDYVLSLAGLRPKGGTFVASMQGSIGEFHAALDAGRTPRLDLDFGRQLVALCQSIASAAFPAADLAPPASPVRLWKPDGPTAPDWDVAVLGGTGFIGRATVARLVADGHTVAVMARNVRGLPTAFAHPRVRVVRGDVRDRDAVAAAIGKARQVVNLAHGGGGANFDEIRQAMVGSAQLVAEMCRAQGVERLVHVGSIAGLWLGDPASVVTGATPPDPRAEQRADYSRAKALADLALIEMHRTANLPVVILRPGLVVGAGTSPFHGGLGFFNNEQHCIGWNRGANPLPFVLVEDVADAIGAACRAPGIEGRCYNLVGDVRPSAREFVGHLAARLHRPLAFHGQSPRRLWLDEVGKWAVKTAVGRSADWPYFRDLASRGLVATFDTADAKADLGWRPVADLETFLDRCLAEPEPQDANAAEHAAAVTGAA